MAVITNTVRFADNAKELAKNLQEGIGTLDVMKSAVDRTVQSLGGTGLFGAANKVAVAIQQMGGVTKLTAAEQERALGIIEKAIEKYTVMGKTAPSALNDIAESLRPHQGLLSGMVGELSALGHSWVARIAEGVLLRDAIREILHQVKDLATFLPELALKGAAVADVEENFKHLTAQAGLLSEVLLGTLRQGTHNTVTDFELMKLVNQDLAAGLRLTDAQFGTLAKGAFALAQATGVDVKTALDSMNEAMLTGRTRSLALLTGKIDLEAAEQKYAASVHKTRENLTDAGKLEAARAAILDSVAAATARLGEQTDGLDERVAQVDVAWNNFKEDLGKGIATSHTLEVAMEGVKKILIEAFGGNQKTLIAAITGAIDDATVELVQLGATGVEVAGFLVKEYYAVQKVFGDFAQIVSGNALAFEYLALGVAKAGAATSSGSAAQKRYAADIERINGNIDSLLISMAARGKALQEDDKAQSGVDGTTAKYVARLEELRAKVEQARAASAKSVGQLHEESTGHDESAAAAKRHADELFKQSEADKKAAEMLRQYNSVGASYRDTIDQMSGAVVEGIRFDLQRGQTQEVLAKVYGVTAEQVAAVAKALKEETEAHHLVDAAMKEAATTTREWIAATTKATTEYVQAHEKAYIEAVAAASTANNEIALLGVSGQMRQIRALEQKEQAEIDGFATLRRLYPEVYDELVEIVRHKYALMKAEAIGAQKDIIDVAHDLGLKTKDDIAGSLELARNNYDALKTSGVVSMSELRKAWQTLHDAEVAARGGVDTYSHALGEAASKMPSVIISSLTGGGGVSGAASGVAGLLGSSLLGNLSSSLTKGMGKVAGDMIGGLFGAAGALIGPAIEALFKLFDHTGSDIARDVGRGWGIKISAGLRDAIVKDVKGGMTEVAAELSHLGDIIKEAGGLNPANLGQFTGRLHDVFSMIETHQLTIAQGTKILDDNWSAFATAATDGDGRIADSLKEIIALNGRFGTQSKEIAAFLKTQGSNAITGFNAVVAGTADAVKGYDALFAAVEATNVAWDKAKKAGDLAGMNRADQDFVTTTEAIRTAAAGASGELADLGIQAVASFAAAVASGTSEADALKALHPSLQLLKQSYNDLGLNVEDVALKSLMMRDTIVNAAPQLMSAIGGLNQEMIALDNLGLMNVDTFGSMQRTGLEMYTRLQFQVATVGGTTKDALLPMQSFLHQAAIEAEKLGIPIDANTQMLIDQSKEAGIWQTAITPQDKLLSGMQTLVDKVNDLVNALLGIPSKVDTTVVTHYQTDGEPPVFNTDNAAARGGLVTATGIRRYAFGGLVQGFAAGGLAAALSMPMAFPTMGTDTVPAMLTPNERVLTVEQNQAFEALLKSAGVSRAAGGVAPGATTNFSTAALESKLDELLLGLARQEASLSRAVARAVRDGGQGGSRR